MTPTRWRQIEDLYKAARTCSPSDRADLLARADPDVRLVVQEMLDQPSDGSPLDHPAWQETTVTSLIQPEIGSQLGPYRIEAMIGAGGMGMVFRAIDTRLGRAVAVKVSSEQFSKRFEREARAISALNHPNVCTLYDVGSLPSGAAYMVTELVEGETLREWMRHSPNLVRSLGVIHQVIEGLSAAHRAGIVHRDLKPANIMVRVDGYVKVLDFGLAKRIRSEDSLNSGELSAPGRIMGTAAYMSPEQITGQDADPRSDLFALGIILYEIVAGCHPWSDAGKSGVDVMHAILHDDPPPTQAPWALDRVVRRCLEKRAADRFQSAGELDKALRQAAADVTQGAKLAQCSIAVLPFANIGEDKENEYFGDGLAEEIINELAGAPGFKVAARTSSFFFKGKNLGLDEIGERLHVEHILEGSIRRAGNRVRITAQLIKIRDGFHLWSERYDREMTDIFAVQDEITQAIAGVLRVKLSPETAPARRYTPNLRAYAAYLKARDLWFKGTRPETLSEFKALLERATELDPKFALASSFLGMYYTVQANLGLTPAQEVIPSAIVIEQQALQIDPSLPEAHAILAVCVGSYDYDWARAERHWRLAVASEPVSRDCLFWYGNHYLAPVGRLVEANDAMERGLEGDPLNLFYRQIYARGLRHGGRIAEAEAELRSILEIDPSFPHALGTLGLICAEQNRFEEALPFSEKAYAAMPWSSPILGQFAAALIHTGNTTRAEALIEELKGEAHHDGPLGLAVFHALNGETELGATWAARAIEQRSVVLIHHVPPLYRPTPWWPGLAKRMNLPA